MTEKIYPWNDWLKQSKFVLIKGIDFDCMPHSMAQQIRTESGKRNKKVSIKVSAVQLLVTVRKK